MNMVQNIAMIVGISIGYIFFVLFIASYLPSLLNILTSMVRAIICLYLLYRFNPFSGSPNGNMQVFLAAAIILFTQTINSVILNHMTSIQKMMESYY